MNGATSDEGAAVGDLRRLADVAVPAALANEVMARVVARRLVLGLAPTEWAAMGGCLAFWGSAVQLASTWLTSQVATF